MEAAAEAEAGPDGHSRAAIPLHGLGCSDQEN
jgi:hypothetical protein